MMYGGNLKSILLIHEWHIECDPIVYLAWNSIF